MKLAALWRGGEIQRCTRDLPEWTTQTSASRRSERRRGIVIERKSLERRNRRGRPRARPSLLPRNSLQPTTQPRKLRAKNHHFILCTGNAWCGQ